MFLPLYDGQAYFNVKSFLLFRSYTFSVCLWKDLCEFRRNFCFEYKNSGDFGLLLLKNATFCLPGSSGLFKNPKGIYVQNIEFNIFGFFHKCDLTETMDYMRSTSWTIPLGVKRFEKILMLCVWWNSERVIYFETNMELYSTQIQLFGWSYVPSWLIENIKKPGSKYKLILKLVIEIMYCEPNPLSPYSKVLIATDCHLFCSMPHFLRGYKISKKWNGMFRIFSYKNS